MMPCMTGWAGLRQMKRGMDSSREIVRNNILRKVSRNRPTNHKRTKIRLLVSKSDRRKAAVLSKKLKSRTFSWKIVVTVALLAFGISFLFYHFMIWCLLSVLCLTVPYLLYLSLVCAKRHKPYINCKIRKSHFKVRQKRDSFPDYVI
jgi:hypothetical protein